MKNLVTPINFSALNPSDRTTIRQLIQLYRQVDMETRKFGKIAGIHCPSLCGCCCVTAKVETTPLEMLPLAVHLWSRQKGDLWLSTINTAGGNRQCVFFKPHISDSKKGRCGVYSLRPLICRLFGFSLSKRKNGSSVYSGCKIMKKEFSKKIQNVQKLLEKNPYLLKMTDFSIRLFGIGSTADRELMPINKAAMIALEKIGFILEKKKTQCKM